MQRYRECREKEGPTPMNPFIVLVSVVLSGPPVVNRSGSWESNAFRWIGEVAHPQLERCARTLGARGVVVVRIKANGAIGVEVESGGVLLNRCVELVRVAWGATRVEGGYVARLPVPDDPVQVGDVVEWREPQVPFAPCATLAECGAGQACVSDFADAGVCVDSLSDARFRARPK